MDQNKAWWIEKRAQRTRERLEAHEFKALYVRTREEAAREIRRHVRLVQTVGVGGSVTIRALGILEELEGQGKKVLDHWKPGLSKEEIAEIRMAQLRCDLFLSSVNAVTTNGELINIDGIGNRINGTVFGPGKVILVAGYQKIVENIEEGMKRIKDVAGPLNAKRLNIDVPCVKVGRCVDCNSPNRICRVIAIHERKPMLTEMLVILVGEEIGY